jgi:hypothetical protein
MAKKEVEAKTNEELEARGEEILSESDHIRSRNRKVRFGLVDKREGGHCAN